MVVDSSVLIEIIFDGPLRKKCETLLSHKNILVPALVIYELYKKIKKQINEEVALETVSSLGQYKILELNRDIALLAADLSIEYNLGMADSVVLACARMHKVDLVTLDNDFSTIPNVKVLRGI